MNDVCRPVRRAGVVILAVLGLLVPQALAGRAAAASGGSSIRLLAPGSSEAAFAGSAGPRAAAVAASPPTVVRLPSPTLDEARLPADSQSVALQIF